MTPERWRRIDDLFQVALKRSPAEREAYLSEVCPDDATRREIRSLISFHEKAETFLEVPAIEAAATLFLEGRKQEMVGLLVGPYRIEAPIGIGGMGEVYLAEDTKLGRKVAIKFLPSYLEADDLAKRRLVKEAKAAAKLDHPNICTIYEVVEEPSHSFIVMQYVQGETLASRIHRAPLDLRETLEIGVQLADALAEAHAHGIVHRDIKPQNIMITPRSQVKVLDFGLAKVFRSAEMSAQTQSQLSAPGLIVGTAPYMSPEQARGDSVDARSDLFSLGVVLYECIAGRTPFSGATPMEICAQVIHLQPPPPSHLNPRVPWELDCVVLKALAKDRIARYESASELLQVLRATLTAVQAEPRVSRRPQTLSLRTIGLEVLAVLSRVWRRPFIFMPVTAMLLAILLLGLFRELPGQRPKPHQPSSEALRWFNVGTTALRNGTYYDASLALQEAVAADDDFLLAHARLAEAWIELGYADRANQELLRARSPIRDLSPLSRLEVLYLEAITHVVLREFPSAIKGYREITEESEDAEKAQAYVDLGRAYEKNNEVEKALESYLKATSLAPSDVAAYLRLGVLYSERAQNLDSALESFRKAQELYQALRNFEGVTEVLYQRGSLFFDQNKYPEAQGQLQKAIETARTTDNHYQQIRTLGILSNVSVAKGHAAEAKQQANQAIEAARARGIDSQIASSLIWLGHVYLMLGEHDDADKSYKEALDLARRDKDSLNEAWALRSLGSLRTQQREADEALGYLEQARVFFEQGGYRKWLSFTLTLIGRAYRIKGDYDAAITVFKDLLQQGEEANDLSQVANSHEEIGSVFAIQQQYPEALSHHNESYEIYKTLNSGFDVGYSAMHRGSVLWQIGRYEEARAALEEASAISVRPDGNQLLAGIYAVNARLKLSEGEFPEARAICQQALDLAGTRYKSTAVQAKYTLGLAQTRSGHLSSGMHLCGEAITLATSTGDPELLSGALLASAEAMLEGGQTQLALETALRAKETVARSEQQDSEWRAWLIAARAKQRLGDESTAREYASYAAARLSNIEQKWGPEAYNGYRSRRDVQHCLNQLGQIL